MVYYLVIKRNEVLTYATTWMNLENTTLNDIYIYTYIYIYITYCIYVCVCIYSINHILYNPIYMNYPE